MSLDSTEVARIARLARLLLDEAELEEYRRDLNGILSLVRRMEAVETLAVEPLAHPLDLKARLRPDEVTEENQKDRLLSIAPAAEHGHYLVPRVID
ncbi:MAG: Asp-tRNA(Asn)/Glu-tRNA(Gln) amidotransferase subunit GatC [Gammaproteobacteria bacterium]|nr:Asp-tRNA(Asn)/Glu-tRNA(Gln) amidotransferase subunit GatC [Gammaproteobacteria bacterium]